MLTQCPQCHTVFRLAPALLEAAQGRVRCGRCTTVFDASADALPETTPDVLLETSAEGDPPPEFQLSEEELEDVFVETPSSFVHSEADAPFSDSNQDTAENEILNLDIAAARAQEDITLEGEEISIVNEETGEYRTNFAVEPTDEERLVDIDEPDAELAKNDASQSEDVEEVGGPPISPADFGALIAMRNRREPDGRRGKTFWVAGSVLLVLLLAVQLVHFNRQSLVRNPTFGPSLASLYAQLGIELDPAWDLGAYRLHQWGAAADVDGVLRVRASLINGSDDAQPYPLLRLTLQDRFGEKVGQRDLEPREYLPGAASGRLLTAGQRIDADIAIVDPGKATVGFELDVCLRSKDRGIACANDRPL